MSLPDDITVAPEFLRGMVDRVNALLAVARPLSQMSGISPVVVKTTTDAVTVELNESGLAQTQTIQELNARIAALESLLTPPSSGTWVLGSVGGSVQWIATEDC